MPDYLLATDNGGTVSKAALFTLDGKEVAVASQKTETITPAADQTEMDMAQTWAATAASIKAVIAEAGIDPSDIAAIACTGHGNGLYLVDEAGEPVRNAIASSDSRARAYTEQWEADGVDVAIRPKTMQAIWPAQPNALLCWLRDNEPESIEKTKWVFMCKDYVRFKLTGEAYAELTDMSGTSLMNVGTGEYDADVLAAFGISEMQEMLPPLKQSADLCGKITAAAAAETGLAEGTPVAGGMFDIDACGLSSAITNESQLCMILGTWGNNQYISQTPVVDEAVFMTSCYSIPGFYLMLEGSATSASNLEWFIAEIFKAEAAQAAAEGKSVYDVLNALVAGTAPQDSNVIYLPFLYGSNVDPDAKASILGLTDRHTVGHVVRAVYEGVIFGHMTHLERLLKFRKMPERIRLSGGAARSEVWAQMISDAFGVPVEVPDGTELGALGAAICAGVAGGCFDSYDAAIDSMVHFKREYQPDLALTEVYKAKYERYKKVTAALDPVWKEIV
jgi:L-xylulokinase